MNLKEQINADFMIAFKAKEMDKKNFLGLLKGEIQLAESKVNSKGVKTFKGEETINGIVKSMEKALKVSGDVDSLRELTYIESYLPKQLSESGLRSVITEYVEREELSTMKDMGKIMGHLKSECGGQYDGKMASNIIKEILG